MGDADNENQSGMSDQELHEWMDEVQTEMDYGLGRMFSHVNGLNDRYAHVLSTLDSWEKLRLCFTAVNILVVPVVMSIVMSYFSSWFVDSNSIIGAGLHVVVFILMLFSAFVGIPIYAFSLCRAYRADGTTVEPKRTQSAPWIDVEVQVSENASMQVSENASMQVSEDGVDCYSVVAEDSSERLSEVGRTFSQRMRDTVRLVISKRASAQATQVELTNPQAYTAPRNDGVSGSFEVGEVTSEEVKLFDIGPDPSSDASVSEVLRRELHSSRNAVDTASGLLDRSREMSEPTAASPRKGLRDIVVERITEGSLKVDGFLSSDAVRRPEIGSQ